MEFNYCRRCSEPLVLVNAHLYNCRNSHSIYANPSPGVGLFLFDHNDMLLMSVRAHSPHKGKLDCFGGFVDGNESLEQALAREMKEELVLDPIDYSSPVYLTSASSPYEYEDEVNLVISCLYYARLFPEAEPIAKDDVAAIRRFSLNDVPLHLIGSNDVRHGLNVLQEKMKSAGTLFD